jgi:hypothetical protein
MPTRRTADVCARGPACMADWRADDPPYMEKRQEGLDLTLPRLKPGDSQFNAGTTAPAP